MERFYNIVIIFSSISALSTWIYCKIKDKNLIHLYYTPHYLIWMFITYCFLSYRAINK